MQVEASTGSGEELDLFEVSRILWRGKWRIAVCVAAFAAAALVYLFNARDWFQADAVLMQSDQEGIPGGLSQLGGLASLAGIRLPLESNSEFPLAVLRSRDFAAQFVAARDIRGALVSEGLLRKPASASGSADLADAIGYFRDRILSISEDQKQGLVTVSMRWVQPRMAAEWSNGFVALLNDRLRTQAIHGAEHNVSYLRQALAETTVPALQQSIGRILEAEMQKLMLARGSGEFAFRVIDEAVVPQERAAPRRALVGMVAVVLGFVVGVGFVLAVHLAALWRRPGPAKAET